MHQSMSGSIHQTAISEIRESYGLSDRQIGCSVSHRLLYHEIIKISHTAIHIFLIEGIKCHTYTLEGLQLIR
ncbi:glycosyltransferase family 25 protein [Segatella copri]|uniref:glycosyltransferase family 25 protein n=1 Tax=Segatella copri TaxID=165179 RepID=UPI003982CAF8